MTAALNRVGDAYAKRTILGDLLHIDVEEPRAEDCSEFMTEVINPSVLILRTMDGVGLITPRDVLMSPLVQLN